MRTAVLMILLTIACSGASAAWVVAVDHETDTSYVDRDSIRKTGKTMKMWVMRDFKRPKLVAGASVLSAKALYEFNCDDPQLRTLDWTEYSGNMGSGKVLRTGYGPEEWRAVRPDSTGDFLWWFPCKGRSLKDRATDIFK